MAQSKKARDNWDRLIGKIKVDGEERKEEESFDFVHCKDSCSNVHDCSKCFYFDNMLNVMPCCDCNSLSSSLKSYFKPKENKNGKN